MPRSSPRPWFRALGWSQAGELLLAQALQVILMCGQQADPPCGDKAFWALRCVRITGEGLLKRSVWFRRPAEEGEGL